MRDDGEGAAGREAAEFARLAACAVRAASDAADLIRPVLGRAVELGRKSSPTDVVTQTDLDAEARLRARLRADVPESGFIGEEGGISSGSNDVVWIVDPLDGTVNFTYGLPIVAVSVAAAVAGRVVAGAVVDVVHGDVFAASLGRGATRNGTPIGVSRCDSLAGAIVTTGFSYNSALRRVQGSVIAELLGRVRDVRCFGSAALQLCWVGCGLVDAYFERDTKLWDYAAGALIAEEAGAAVELPCPENDGLSIAVPPRLFNELRDLVDHH